MTPNSGSKLLNLDHQLIPAHAIQIFIHGLSLSLIFRAADSIKA